MPREPLGLSNDERAPPTERSRGRGGDATLRRNARGERGPSLAAFPEPDLTDYALAASVSDEAEDALDVGRRRCIVARSVDLESFAQKVPALTELRNLDPAKRGDAVP
ncbi:MAG TPA: hypothetical protein VG319_07345 [Polyangia bacterium]|nr:hypothetical protein [Polyangia bacterium]